MHESGAEARILQKKKIMIVIELCKTWPLVSKVTMNNAMQPHAHVRKCEVVQTDVTRRQLT